MDEEKRRLLVEGLEREAMNPRPLHNTVSEEIERLEAILQHLKNSKLKLTTRTKPVLSPAFELVTRSTQLILSRMDSNCAEEATELEDVATALTFFRATTVAEAEAVRIASDNVRLASSLFRSDVKLPP